jgi:hypothetical protein
LVGFGGQRGSGIKIKADELVASVKYLVEEYDKLAGADCFPPS